MHTFDPPTAVNRYIRNAPSNIVFSLGHLQGGPHYRTTRPHGRNDWLLFWTLEGEGWLQRGSHETGLRPDSLAVYQSGVPQDYGTRQGAVVWSFLYAHVPPQESWLSLVDSWPQPIPGVAILQVEDEDIRQRIESHFAQAIQLSRQPLRHSQSLATHAIASMLFWADELVPGERGGVDPRVRIALEMAGRRLDHHWTAQELAQGAGVSVSRLRTLFREQVGEAPVLLAERLRLEFAAELIAGGGLTVQEAADATGYKDPFHFSRRFKIRMGCPPSKWKIPKKIPSVF